MAETSGGRVRDTLAGIFHDRPPRRFAYASISATLAMLSALGLLFAVAARRLALPDALARLPARAAERRRLRREERERRAVAVPEAAPQTSPPAAAPAETDTAPSADAPVTGTSLDALRQAKARSRRMQSTPPARPPPKASSPLAPGAATRPAPAFSPPASGTPPSSRPSNAPRTRSAAEILLERRRGRQR